MYLNNATLVLTYPESWANNRLVYGYVTTFKGGQGIMKNRFPAVTVLGFMFAVFVFAAAPARSDDVDQRIKVLEDELMKLKSEQAQVKTEQLEMRKEATAAATALPNFN